jgi:hypothetical protein
MMDEGTRKDAKDIEDVREAAIGRLDPAVPHARDLRQSPALLKRALTKEIAPARGEDGTGDVVPGLGSGRKGRRRAAPGGVRSTKSCAGVEDVKNIYLAGRSQTCVWNAANSIGAHDAALALPSPTIERWNGKSTSERQFLAWILAFPDFHFMNTPM